MSPCDRINEIKKVPEHENARFKPCSVSLYRAGVINERPFSIEKPPGSTEKEINLPHSMNPTRLIG